MQRLALPVVGVSGTMLLLSLGQGERGVVGGIFGIALGAVLHLAGGGHGA